MKDPTTGSKPGETVKQAKLRRLLSAPGPLRDPFLPPPTMKRHKP